MFKNALVATLGYIIPILIDGSSEKRLLFLVIVMTGAVRKPHLPDSMTNAVNAT
jgi:hypothetical protein